MERNEGQAGEGRAGRPFCEATDPALYVPRDATEVALDAVVRGVLDGEHPVTLGGPPGIGKTLLLHRTAARVRHRFETVYLPYCALEISDLCAWALGLLGRQAGGDPETRIRRESHRLRGQNRGIAFLIDDANSMPLETARALAKFYDECQGALRLALASTDDARASRVFAAFDGGDGTAHAWLTKPMAAAETRRYVQLRLERSDAPSALVARFDDSALDWIHTLSRGIPRLVNDVAASLIETRPEDVSHAWWEERWLGAPLEEDAPADGDLADDHDLLDLELPAILLDAEPRAD